MQLFNPHTLLFLTRLDACRVVLCLSSSTNSPAVDPSIRGLIGVGGGAGIRMSAAQTQTHSPMTCFELHKPFGALCVFAPEFKLGFPCSPTLVSCSADRRFWNADLLTVRTRYLIKHPESITPTVTGLTSQHSTPRYAAADLPLAGSQPERDHPSHLLYHVRGEAVSTKPRRSNPMGIERGPL